MKLSLMATGLLSSRTSCPQPMKATLSAGLVLLIWWQMVIAAADTKQPSPVCIEQGLCTCYSSYDPPACYDPGVYHCVGADILAQGTEPSGQCAIHGSAGADDLPSTNPFAAPEAISIQGSQGLQVLFYDDFQTLDSSRWGYDIGDGSDYKIPGWGNAEFECYTTDAANAAIIPNPDESSASLLRIRTIHSDAPQTCINRCTEPSQKQWTSAKLTTRNLHSFAPSNGPTGCQSVVVESRIRLPLKQGHWAAFWMLPQDYGQGWPHSGEIDIMEHVNMDTEILGTVHLANADGSHMQAPFNNHIPLSATAVQDYNIYKIIWGCDSISWYLNDNYAYSVHRGDLPNWPFDKPFYIMLNLAVGGYLPGFDADLSGGELLVDYVRVYSTVA